jgi:hypothetical protein
MKHETAPRLLFEDLPPFVLRLAGQSGVIYDAGKAEGMAAGAALLEAAEKAHLFIESISTMGTGVVTFKAKELMQELRAAIDSCKNTT